MRNSFSKYSSSGDLNTLRKIKNSNSCTCKVIKRTKRSWLVRIVVNAYELVKGSLKLGEEVVSESAKLLINKPECLMENVDDVCEECSRTNNVAQNCPSCTKDSPATIICALCQRFVPDLGGSSCKNCQDTRPVIKMCMKYHSRQPEIRLCPCRKCIKNRQILTQFWNGSNRYDDGDHKRSIRKGRGSRYFLRDRKRPRNVKQRRYLV